MPLAVALLLSSAGLISARTFTNVADVLALSPERLAKMPPVRLRGVVTYFKGAGSPDLIVQDATAGIFVGGKAVQAAHAWQPGDVVEVEGTAIAESFAPRVQARHVQRVGTGLLPNAATLSSDDLRSGQFDGRYVEARGVVRSAVRDDSLQPPRLILRVATAAGQFDAWVLHFSTDDAARLVDAAVALRGVCLAWANQRRQLLNVRLLVNRGEDIQVTRAALVDPFTAPLVAPDTLMRYRPEGLDAQRVRLRGVITWWRAGEGLVLQDGTSGVRVDVISPPQWQLGDEVEAVGFPGLNGYTAGLQDALVRVVAQRGAVEPLPLTAQEILLADHDQRLVRVTGRLRALQREGGLTQLFLRSGEVDFTAVGPRDDVRAWEETLEPGSELALTGVCELRPGEERRLGGRPQSFALLLREAGDVTVLQSGPWLNERRLRWLLGLGGGALALALLWGFLLRRRVEKRTTLLAREIRSRRDEADEFDAVLTERGRLAAELHDTVQQSLTGAALQLRAAGLALSQAPPEARPHLDTARQLIDHSRDELRAAVWDLRVDSGASTDLPAALRDTAASTQTGGGKPVSFTVTGEPRPVPPTLAHHASRIAQEALTNSLRHSDAAAFSVTLTFLPAQLRLSIQDNGRGFDPARSAGPDTGHFGVDGMKRRAAKIGGTLALESNVDGTTISLTTPLA